MGKIDISGLSDSFRQARNQCLVSVKLEAPKEKVSANKRRNVSSDKYSEFLKKYDDLANTVDSFSTYDLMYFFREKAREAGIKYVIANMKRDKISKVADALGVKPSYLMGWEDNLTNDNADFIPDILSDTELIENVKKLQQLSEEHKRTIYDNISYWYEKEGH